MDFFARQEDARARTRSLVALFVLAVVVVDLAVTAVLVVLIGGGAGRGAMATDLAGWVSANALGIAGCALAVLGIILVGAAAKAFELRGGGAVVARRMGADLVSPDTTDPAKRRLLNVVEEMAIASGVPVPGVYVMEGEGGINAFAAGHTPADSVIAVTRGALDRFDRAQLQGVIAHEFSHILNADVRRNMDLMAMVAGLFAIATVGRLVMRGGSRSRKGGGAIVLVGLAMLVLGYVGVLFGRMLQAAISRQREYLADASAVQFTRDPHGLRDALVLVSAVTGGSRLLTDEAHQVAHMFFASGVNDLFATHPPLAERIRALDPTFEPEQMERLAKDLYMKAPPRRPAPVTTPLPGAVAVALAGGAIAGQVANPRAPHIRHAERLRAALPPGLAAETTDPARARALVVALVGATSSTPAAAREAALADAFGPELAAAARAHGALGPLAPDQRLPLLLQAIPALGRLPFEERRRLVEGIDRMVRADGTLTLHEFALARLARVHLGEQLARPAVAGDATLLQLEADLVTVLATLARAGHAEESEARDAFERGLTRALPGRQAAFRLPEDWPGALDGALDRLDRLRPGDKPRLLDALALVVAHDGTLETDEAELLRAICGSLHCPLPPFIGIPEEPAA